MPLLTLKRKTRYGHLSTIKIKINEDRVVPLRYAEEKTADLPVGIHVLVAKGLGTKSWPLSIMLSENDHKCVIVDCLPLLEAGIKA